MSEESDNSEEKTEKKTLEPDQDTVYKLNDWVCVNYEGEVFTGLVMDIDNEDGDFLYRVRCLQLSSRGKSYRLESDENAVWYGGNDVVGHPTKSPTKVNSRGLYKL